MAADPVNASAPTCQLDTKALSAAKSSAEDSSKDPLIGREVIGQYRIEKKLGSGGMGSVYLVQQTTVQRPAVIKVLKTHSDDKLDLAARFAIEARAASNLNHPNIVTIYNYGQMEDGTLFLAMEYLEGETLEARIARCGQLSVDRAVHVATQIAQALGEAHAHGVVHRDLKPANVMLVERAGDPDFVKILDFGIAKLDDAGVTSAGFVVGTPRYMSPEQLLGKQLDRRSDVYSAGIVLYEMLAGQTPFSSDTPIGWVHQHVDAAPKPPSSLVKGHKIPPPLERVVLRALEKTPAARPDTMEEFAEDLAAALREPPPPPWWLRAVRVVGRRLVASSRLMATLLVLLGSTAWRFVNAICRKTVRSARSARSGSWRGIKAIGRGIRRSVRAAGSALSRIARAIGGGLRATLFCTGRFARAIGRGVRRFARAVGSGFLKSVRALGAVLLKLLRGLRSGIRRFVLLPPVRLGKLLVKGLRSMLATRRRRIFVALSTALALALTLGILFSDAIERRFLATKPEIAKTKDHHAPTRPPAHTHDKKH